MSAKVYVLACRRHYTMEDKNPFIPIDLDQYTLHTHTPMKRQDYINKIKSKVKDPLTKRLRYTSNDAVIDDAVSYYYEELKHNKQIP